MSIDDYRDAYEQVRNYVEGIVYGYLNKNGCGGKFENVKNEAQCQSQNYSIGIDQDLKYLDGLTNGAVEYVSKAKNVSVEDIHQDFVNYYLKS